MVSAFPFSKNLKNGHRKAEAYRQPPVIGGEHTITQTLNNATSTITETTIEDGASLSGSLAVAEGYVMDSVAVVMGNADITATAYNSGTHAISIESVSGDVVIIATARTETEQAGGGVNVAGPRLVDISTFKNFLVTVQYTDRYHRPQSETFTHTTGQTAAFSKVYQVLSESDIYLTINNLKDSDAWVVSASAGGQTENLGSGNPIKVKLKTPANPESSIVGLYRFTFDGFDDTKVTLSAENGLFATKTTLEDFSIVYE